MTAERIVVLIHLLPLALLGVRSGQTLADALCQHGATAAEAEWFVNTTPREMAALVPGTD